MNKKGFTLVELLAAIFILGVIVTLGVVSMTSLSSNIKEKNKEQIISNIEIAGAKYAFDTKIESVTVQELVLSGYLESDNDSNQVIDPTTNTPLNDCNVYMQLKGSYYVATVKCDNSSSGLVQLRIVIRQNGVEKNNGDWIRPANGTVTLTAYNGNSTISGCSTTTCLWSSTSGIDQKGNSSINITSQNEYRDTVKFTYIKDNKMYSKTITMKIDNKGPQVVSKSANKAIFADMGSGIDSYKIGNGSWVSVNNTEVDVTLNSGQTVTIKDKLGNQTSYTHSG